MISAKFLSSTILSLLVGLHFCAAPQQPAQQTSQSKENYPPNIEASPARQQAAEDAWNAFLTEYKIAFTKLEFEPILYTPHSLPAGIANQISINPPEQKAGEALTEAQAKEYLRRFIEHQHIVLSGDQRSSALGLKDISLINFSGDGNMYRASYQQMNFPFPLTNGFGELHITISKTGMLLQLSSTIVPTTEFVARPKIENAEIAKRFLGREFTYSNIAGQPMTYKVAQASEASVKDLVIFPDSKDQKLMLHLAYPVEVGRGTTWTVYIDAVTGEEISVKQNFQS